MTTHLVFGYAAAHSLRQAFHALGVTDRLLVHGDGLGLGPIDSVDPAHRARWWRDELGFDMDPDGLANDAAFWRGVDDGDDDLVLWLSTRSASERCGLMEVLRRTAPSRLKLVDVASTHGSISIMRHDDMIAQNLPARAAPLDAATVARHAADWSRLRAETGALRLLSATGFISAPIDHYDESLLCLITSTWQSCARIVGNAIALTYEPIYHQAVTDNFLWSRLLQLTALPALDARTDEPLWSMRTSYVKRRTPT